MIKCIILDLDGTIVNTDPLAQLRAEGRWREVRDHLHLCSMYKDVVGVLNTARAVGIKVAICTNSPSAYVKTVFNYFQITVDYVVAFHDVQQHKPHSEGINNILSHFNIEKHEAVFLGDSNEDMEASASAGVEFFTVDWSTVTHVDSRHRGVAQLSSYIGSRIEKQSRGLLRTEIQQLGNRFFLGYYLNGIKQEVWSFKDGDKENVQRWVEKSLELSSNLPAIDIVVRALGHKELEVNQYEHKPLDYLSSCLAARLGAIYIPHSLSKCKKLKKSAETTNSKERFEQVRGVYSLDAEVIGDRKDSLLTFLIVDDVLTSGATTSEISRAISAKYPNASIYIFTLVKTLYRADALFGSSEWQHNNQLYSDLYNPVTRFVGTSEGGKVVPPQLGQQTLASKKYSANYARTNHNFVIQNLKPYSISSELPQRSIFTAIQVVKNLLQRGNPTIASRKLRNSFGLDYDNSGIDTPSQALISCKPVEWKRLIRGDEQAGNYPAKHFFEDLLPKYLGDYIFLKQLIVPEVQIFDMTQVYVDQFQNRQVDFYIPHAGLIIEIDGSQHQGTKPIDDARDTFTSTLGLKTVRFTTQEIASENLLFQQKINGVISHIKLIDKLEREGTLYPPNGITLSDYQAAYSDGINSSDPRVKLTASIRFQVLLLELLERGTLKFDQASKLTLVNHDRIEFAFEALEDLNDIFNNLFCLMGMPACSIDLEIDEVYELPNNREGSSIVLDFSIYERYDDSFQTNLDVIYLRTHYLDFYRHFISGDAVSIETSTLVDYDFFELACAEPITYDLDLSPNGKQREALRYFLSNLFLPLLKDVDFREGQVGIIGSALSRRGTIGLLPTGSGKSICYQLSAILQPAVSFVVCPIKSLMYDQKADLDSIGFTRCNFITSDLSASEKAKVQRDFGRGKYFFVFISPERFQTHGFRREMAAIGLDHTFAYAVIDEAHCLSEWGHDFRTSYLNLANTIEVLAPAASYIGLTATASVNVLKDIQTEFDIPDDNVRTPLEFTREELSFHVLDDKGNKSEAALQLVAEMDEKWNEYPNGTDKAGIVFTPTVNGQKGCYQLAGELASRLNMDVRYFCGSPPKRGGIKGAAFDEYKRQVQNDFKQNEYRVLTATKAFGMGVNKGNIAYTVHFGIPGSMEALYQEAGRAGRDKSLFQSAPADCYVLLTKEENTELLDKIWDSSTTVSDLKGHVKGLSRDSDVNTNLFLMTSGLDTINDEYKLIVSIYQHLEHNSEGRSSIILLARDFDTDKFKLEKAIYRLSQLGIVSDWVIEDFFNGKLYVEFECIDEDRLTENIENTIRKYEPGFRLNDAINSENQFYKIITQRLESGSITKTKFVFLVLLLWSYDHFVYNRRQSLKTVYEQCSDLAAGIIREDEFKERLEGYFKFNESSHILHHLAENSADTDTWLSVFFKENDEGEKELLSEKELNTLKEQLSRFLESYKDNTCLNYLSGILRLTSDQFDDADGERRMAASIEHLMAQDPDTAKGLVEKTLALKPIFSTDAQSRFAKFANEKFSDNSLLKLINKKFKDPYSYHQLLKPMVSKLDKIITRYRGIDW
jgi:ATP-dependent DNA helicase RecQ